MYSYELPTLPLIETNSQLLLLFYFLNAKVNNLVHINRLLMLYKNITLKGQNDM